MKRKAISLVLCVAMILSAMTFSVSAATVSVVSDFNSETFSESGTWPTGGMLMESSSLVPDGMAAGNAAGSYDRQYSVNYDLTNNDYYLSFYTNLETTVKGGTSERLYVVFDEYTANSKNVKLTIMANSATAGYMRPFINFGDKSGNVSVEDENNDGTGTANTSDTTRQMASGKTYQVVLRTNGNASMTLAVYDVESGKQLGKTVTASVKEGSVSNKGYITLSGRSIGTKGVIADFNVDEMKDAVDKSAAAAVYDALQNVSFDEFSSTVNADVASITFPDESVNDDGVSIKYVSADENLISENGVVNHPDIDTRTFIKAIVSKGDISFERAFAVTVKADAAAGEAKTIMDDDFSGYTTLGGSAWTKLDKSNCGSAVTAKSGVSVATIGNFSIRRSLSDEVDLDSESTYYASWTQAINVNKANDFVGAGFMNFGTDNKYNNRAALSWNMTADNSIPVVKAILGTNVSNELTTDIKIYPGTLYNILMKLETHAEENDTVSFKIWPVDGAEPLNWTCSYSANASGKCGDFALLTLRTTADAKCNTDFGNVKAEMYSRKNAEKVESLMAQANGVVQGTVDENDINTEDFSIKGVAYNSAKNMLNLKGNAYVKEISILDVENSYKPTVITPSAGTETVVSVIYANDSAFEINGKKYLAAFVAYGAKEEMFGISAYTFESENITANGSYKKGLTMTIPDSTSLIRVYIWDADTLKPIINGITLADNKMINY